MVQPSNNAAFVIDHTVVWENGDLVQHAVDKERYYVTEAIVSKIRQLHPSVTNVSFCGLVIGARGVWCQKNDLLWCELNLPVSLKAAMMSVTLHGSLQCYRYFMHASSPFLDGCAT